MVREPLRHLEGDQLGYRARTLVAVLAIAMLLATSVYLYVRGDAWAPIVGSEAVSNPAANVN
jgi:hypothetical protein